MEWVAKKPDDHLRCLGLRWCGVKACGEMAEVGKECKPCKRRRHRKNGPRWLLNPANRAKRNAYAAKWEAARRRGDHPTYQRQKAHKRQKHQQQVAA
jgi:hypothetical protein